MGRMRGAEAAEAKRFFGRLCECRNTNGSPVRACCALVCVSLSLLVLEAFFIKRSKRCLCLVCVCACICECAVCVCAEFLHAFRLRSFFRLVKSRRKFNSQTFGSHEDSTPFLKRPHPFKIAQQMI